MIRRTANLLFRYRSYTPIPAILVLWVVSRTSEGWLLLGAGVAALGEAIRIWALRHAGPKTRSHRKIRVDDLVVTGPYSLTRNPLYIANLVLGLGVCLAAAQPWIIPVYLIVFTIQYAFIIRAEEEFLESALGDVYREYRGSVPRVLPRLGGYAGGRHRYPFREILPRELSTITAAEAVLALLGLRILFPGIPGPFVTMFGS